ncbi:MAG TPA: glycosyltransferase [Actinomycetales bacterium]|nr:glycosyltransferase [Actinomycetales bacterium]
MSDVRRGDPHWRLAVVIPAFNEAAGITATLKALAQQDDLDFDVVICDNNSTDATVAVIEYFIAERQLTRWRVVSEKQKGTGAAADTAIRAAIAAGATHIARTDADCLPARNWVRLIRAAFSSGSELIAGKLIARTDDRSVSPLQQRVLAAAVAIAGAFGRFRPGNQGPDYLGPYMMSAGCNMAITSELYENAGGFPRTAIEDVHEDRALVNAVRKISWRYRAHPEVIVFASARRADAWGLLRTLGWYADHRYRPDEVDIR